MQGPSADPASTRMFSALLKMLFELFYILYLTLNFTVPQYLSYMYITVNNLSILYN